MQDSTKVPVGVTTKVGYGTALAAFVAAAVAYLTGNHSQAQLGTLSAAGVGLAILVVTQIGRYVQASKLAQKVVALGEPVFSEIKSFDPGIVSQVETVVKAEGARLEAALRHTQAPAWITHPPTGTVTFTNRPAEDGSPPAVPGASAPASKPDAPAPGAPATDPPPQVLS